jgi:hypothetical protein
MKRSCFYSENYALKGKRACVPLDERDRSFLSVKKLPSKDSIFYSQHSPHELSVEALFGQGGGLLNFPIQKIV